MPLIVETGANVANANGLTDASYVVAYHAANGTTVTNDTTLEDAIVRATTWVTGFTFNGTPVNGRSQSLPFPMSGLTDKYGNAIAEDEVPREVQNAVAEAALLEQATPGVLNPSITAEDGRIKSKTEKVDVLSESVEYWASDSTDSVQADTNKRAMDWLDGLIASPAAAASGGFKTSFLARA